MNGCDSDHSHTDLCMTDDAPLDNVTLRHSTVSRGDVTVEQKRTFLTTTETHRAIQEHEAILWTSSRNLLDDGILQWSTWAVNDPVQLVSAPSSPPGKGAYMVATASRRRQMQPVVMVLYLKGRLRRYGVSQTYAFG